MKINVNDKVITRFTNNEGTVTRVCYDLDGDVYKYEVEFHPSFFRSKHKTWEFPTMIAKID